LTIAARVVEAFPKETWHGGECELIEDDDPKHYTEFERAFAELDDRIQVWNAFYRVDVLAGLGRYAVLLIGAPGELDTPLKKLSPDQVLYLTPFAEEDALITQWDADSNSPRFGRPIEYKLTRSGISGSAIPNSNTSVTRTVHYTRVLHVADGLLDDFLYGLPRLERVWNALDDFEKVLGAGAEAFWNRSHQGMVVEFDKEADVKPAEATAIKSAADEMIHGFRRTMAVQAGKVNMLGSDVANFNQPIDAILTVISGATGIPKRILMGSERGELASSQDATSFDTQVSDRRREYAGPIIVKPFVQRMIELGALPKPTRQDTPGGYDIRWPELYQLTEEKRAAVAVQWAQLNANAKNVVVRANEIRDKVLGLEALTPEEIAAELQAQSDAAVAATPPQLQPQLGPDGQPIDQGNVFTSDNTNSPPTVAEGKARPGSIRGLRRLKLQLVPESCTPAFT